MSKRVSPWLCALWLAGILSLTAEADYKGTGKASDDYASYNIKTIGLLIVGTWKGSDAKVEPTAVAMPVKARLRELGYEIDDVRDKKHLKALEGTVDAILTIKYESMAGQKSLYYHDNEPGKYYEHMDRYIKGSAEMVTTKRTSKKKKTIFKSVGQTAKQKTETGVGDRINLSNPTEDFASIIADLPAAAKDENAEAKKEDTKAGEEKKDEKKGEKEDEKKDDNKDEKKDEKKDDKKDEGGKKDNKEEK